MPQCELKDLCRSLYLVSPCDLEIEVVTEGKEFDNPRRRVRALFTIENILYKIVVTDPLVERYYLGKQDGNYQLDEAVLCVSLGDLYEDGYAYKLAAAIITARRAKSAK